MAFLGGELRPTHGHEFLELREPLLVVMSRMAAGGALVASSCLFLHALPLTT